jgi:cellobiose phosphorylase
MGIAEEESAIRRISAQFNTPAKINNALEKTKKFWAGVSNQASVLTGRPDFDNWFRWVSIQPVLRRIFGCSFLPDFDYGKGGRGWRDLWQDCLSLILNDPRKARPLLINNFSGVRIDGSNATIIGKEPGEFIADRNNIARVWMDHGVWPLLTLELYLNRTADTRILFAPAPYFRDQHILRLSACDKNWKETAGNKLKTKTGKIYQGSILEHLLVQHLVQFFNVGKHNYIRLEGADWNDGLDMAAENGESVAFSCMYAHNLRALADLLLKAGRQRIKLAAELKILFREVSYADARAKRKVLEKYFTATKSRISGRKIDLDAVRLAEDLKCKSEWLTQHIRKNEWLKEGFFNGYYDNLGRRVEGKIGGKVRMMLASQVFAIMSGVAEDKQVKQIIKSVNKYLRDSELGGLHLNTDFGQEQHNFGRAFSFVYGDKENGAFFNHMAVMYAYALIKRGYIKEGEEALDSIYRMAVNTAKSKIYPCLPEYFNLEGRGMYSYLTGSASWFVLTKTL